MEGSSSSRRDLRKAVSMGSMVPERGILLGSGSPRSVIPSATYPSASLTVSARTRRPLRPRKRYRSPKTRRMQSRDSRVSRCRVPRRSLLGSVTLPRDGARPCWSQNWVQKPKREALARWVFLVVLLEAVCRAALRSAAKRTRLAAEGIARVEAADSAVRSGRERQCQIGVGGKRHRPP